MNESQITAAGEALLRARRTHVALDVNDHDAAPTSVDHAYAIQAVVAAGCGAVGGWKVGAPSPHEQATYAPLAADGVHRSGVELPDDARRLRGIEVEVAFSLGKDLPARAAPWTRDEVADAVHGAVPIIEVVETRFTDRDTVGAMWALSDNLSHGGLIVGDLVTDWRALSLDEIPVTLKFDERTIIDRNCRNAGGHPFDMVVKLANLCASHCGGLRAGQIITTGSLMGVEFAPPGAHVSATVGGVGAVEMTFSK